MKKPKILSFHPKLAAVLDVVFGLLMMWWFQHLRTGEFLAIWFVLRMLWWLLLIRMVYYSPGLKRISHLFSLIIFHCGITLWLLFVEWVSSRYLVVGVGILFSAISFWLLPVVRTELSFIGKPQRRFRLLLSMIGLSGIWGGIGALYTFNIYAVSIPVWIISGSVVSVIVGIFWWKEYGIDYKRSFWLWSLGGLILLIEFSWIILYWPSGFLVNGFIIVWLWYVFWLLGRFHLSTEGINWKKHRWFLGVQALLLLLFLLSTVKWK